MTDDLDYAVVVNDEDQFSIWDASSPPPPGWRSADFTGTRADCLAHIELVWTDMRPRSLRVATEQPVPTGPAPAELTDAAMAAGGSAGPSVASPDGSTGPEPRGARR